MSIQSVPEAYRPLGGTQVSLTEWAEETDVRPLLLPFEYREYDPIDVLLGIRSAIEELAPTAATFRVGPITEHLPCDARRIHHTREYMELAGAWRLNANADSLGSRWVNPNYVHKTALEPNITDRDERLETIDRLASYGTLTIADVAPRFGIERKSLERWLLRNDVAWSEPRSAGVRTLARTCLTTIRWSEWTVPELARALGVAHGTLSSWLTIHARDTEFEVPADPSTEPWFNGYRSEFGGSDQ